jgi:hypothetical protein
MISSRRVDAARRVSCPTSTSRQLLRVSVREVLDFVLLSTRQSAHVPLENIFSSWPARQSGPDGRKTRYNKHPQLLLADPDPCMVLTTCGNAMSWRVSGLSRSNPVQDNGGLAQRPPLSRPLKTPYMANQLSLQYNRM